MPTSKPSTSMSESTPLKSASESTSVASPDCCRHCQTCNPAPILSMKTVKTILWYIAIGFAATALNRYLGVYASPVGDMSGLVSRDIYPSMDIFYKGEHLDNSTGYSFELYTVDDSLDEDTAFANYMAAYVDDNDNLPALHKRSWYDCKHLSNLQTLGCNTGHALGGFVSATGSAAFGGYLGTLLGEAFSNGRDDDKPRSVCLSRDKHNLCVSWASYTGSGLKSGESNDITYYSTQCANSGGSAEFKTSMADGGILFICVSDRADGCGKSVC
ncbi:hypothetical protein QM012_000029 [Aureobasidium pullulans]|uniref:WD-like domain-containing protein n=1 Tax=Aureobasidium pullulans TaxID=5580 RepID=A0ABR0TVD0_AURPU